MVKLKVALTKSDDSCDSGCVDGGDGGRCSCLWYYCGGSGGNGDAGSGGGGGSRRGHPW